MTPGMNTPKRCHPLMIVDTTYRTLFGLIFLIAVNLFEGLFEDSADESGEMPDLASGIPWIAIALLLLLLVILLFSFLKWRYTFYYLDDSNFILQKGRIRKNKITLPFERINTVDLSQNLFHQVFGLSRLKLDSGAVTPGAKNAEVDLLLKTADAEALRGWILHRKEQLVSSDSDLSEAGAPPEVPAIPPDSPGGFSARTWDFIRLGLTGNKLGINLALMMGIIGIGSQFFNLKQMLGNTETFAEVAEILLPLTGGVLLFWVIAGNVVSVVRSLLTYYQFRVYRVGDHLCVAHGLFSKKNYTLPISKIHCVTFRQNLLQQWLKLTEITVTAIGYGDGDKEIAMLFPIAKWPEAELILQNLLPEFPFVSADRTSVPAGWVIRFLLGTLLLLLIAGGLSFLSPYFWLVLLLLIPAALSQFLQYRNTALGFEGGVLRAGFGGLIKSTVLIRRSSIQSTAARRGMFARWLGYFQAGIAFYGGRDVRLSGMKDESFEMLRSAALGFDGKEDCNDRN